MDSSLRLELLKNKTENARSAVASQEVLEHLAGFIRSKRQGSISQLDYIQKQNKLQDSNTTDNCGGIVGHYYASCSGDCQSDDHPLRKTASMPTMHIPYKAQSLSRRRQLERRTTMSPLTRRKSKPKPKRPVHSQIDRMNSNSTEYSSNPCIIQATRANARSLSQLTTPPPSDHSDLIPSSKNAANFSSKSDVPSSASPSLSGPNKQMETIGKFDLSTELRTIATSDIQSKSLMQQRHLKVNEAIRETVNRRSSDKQLVNNASLDLVNIPTTAPSSHICDNSLGEDRVNSRRNHFPLATSNEFRQWSLDEPKEKLEHGKSSSSGMFQRASFSGNKRRPNIYNDTNLNASRLSYHSPCSSVSIGAGGHTLMAASQQHQMISCIRPPPNALSGAHNKHLYSSSSSSTSSLLSQQDSFDDSSSQAIDLSSSSERQRSGASGSHHVRSKNNQLLPHQQQLVHTTTSQKLLQESFRQLQLCQAPSQDTTPKQLLLNPIHAQQHSIIVHPAPLSATNLPSILNSATIQQRMQHTSSLDESVKLLGEANNTLAGSSSQTMIPTQAHLAAIHQSTASTGIQQTPDDLKNLLIAYKNLVGYQSHQQPSGVEELTEPYKASLLSNLLQQQQQQQPIIARPSPELYQPIEPTKSSIWRTFSSPLLATSMTRDKTPNSSLAHLSSLEEKRNSTVGMQVDEQPPETVHQKKLPELQSLDLSVNSAQDKVQDSSETHSGEVLVADATSTNQSNRNDEVDMPTFNPRSTTGITYDLEMCNHKCICGNEGNHPENSYRVLAIWVRLQETGLMGRCARIEGRKATFEELRLCHSDVYTQYFGKTPIERLRLSHLDLTKLPIKGLLQLECGGQGADIDTAWNEDLTPKAARLATGCVIEAALSVATGKLLNAFAIVRPPGHHAEYQQAMGFCYFNSVAIAASVLINKQLAKRILIVDWDVHHGNGIQRLFYEDNRVLYISLHRHDRGNFFPGTGDPSELGLGQGLGYNINIAWSNEIMSDAEYLAAFRSIVMPIARAFDPCLVLVASGFDAARGHAFNFGGYYLSAQCFAFMTRQLMTLAKGRLVLCLEGGYQLNAICDCAESCLRALLNESRCDLMDKISELELRREPNQSACETLYELSNYAAKHWVTVKHWRSTIEQSALEAAVTSSSR